MSIVGTIVIFLITWWTVLFTVLPWGVKSRHEAPDDGVEGAEPGAPVDPQLKRKLLITTCIALVITAALSTLIASGLINFRQ